MICILPKQNGLFLGGGIFCWPGFCRSGTPTHSCLLPDSSCLPYLNPYPSYPAAPSSGEAAQTPSGLSHWGSPQLPCCIG